VSVLGVSFAVAGDQVIETRVHSAGGHVVAAVTCKPGALDMAYLDIQSSTPGALRRLARALAEAEDRADAARAVLTSLGGA
jgi:hypothetical protein